MRRLVALVVLVAALVGPCAAHAETFTRDEDARLARGETVERMQVLSSPRGHYVGGVTFTVLDASPEQLDAALANVSAYARILPYTKDVRFVGGNRDDFLVWLRQGTSFLEASYTIRVRAAAVGPEERLVRFWLDPSRPHGIDDASGFFRYEPLAPTAAGKPRGMLTFGIWVNIGGGFVRSLFEGRVQHIVMTIPQRVRAYVAARST